MNFCDQVDFNSSYTEYKMKPLDKAFYLNQMTVPKYYFCQFEQILPTHQFTYTITINLKPGLR